MTEIHLAAGVVMSVRSESVVKELKIKRTFIACFMCSIICRYLTRASFTCFFKTFCLIKNMPFLSNSLDYPLVRSTKCPLMSTTNKLFIKKKNVFNICAVQYSCYK